jgi:hypothetical protein
VRPPEERIITSDCTVERLAGLLADNPKGLILARDELSAWLGGYKRYRGRDGGSDLADWLEIHRAGPISRDRQATDRRAVYVPRAAVSICGTATPGVMARCLCPENVEAGLAARLLMAMPPRRPKRWTENVIDSTTQTAYAKLLSGLAALKPLAGGAPVPLLLTEEARSLWIDHYNSWAQLQAGADGEEAALLSKLEGGAARLALIHHVVECVARGENAESPVGAESISAGIALARWFYAESIRIYSALRETEGERATRRLIEFLRRHGPITARLLHKTHRRRYPDAAAAEAALDALAAAGLGEWRDCMPGPKGGRPTRMFVLTCGDETQNPRNLDDGDEGGDDDAPPKPPESGTKPPPTPENAA